MQTYCPARMSRSTVKTLTPWHDPAQTSALSPMPSGPYPYPAIVSRPEAGPDKVGIPCASASCVEYSNEFPFFVENIQSLPVATQIAGVQFRLEPGAYRELHWHQQAEWAYMLNGCATIAVVSSSGQNYVQTINTGDLWYFPKGSEYDPRPFV